MLEGWAKEDARYVLCLATEAQLGMTLNTRNLELMLRRLAACPLDEAREYSRQLYDATKDIAPSLVRYTAATEYDCLTRADLREIAATIIGKAGPAPPPDRPKRSVSSGRHPMPRPAPPQRSFMPHPASPWRSAWGLPHPWLPATGKCSSRPPCAA